MRRVLRLVIGAASSGEGRDHAGSWTVRVPAPIEELGGTEQSNVCLVDQGGGPEGVPGRLPAQTAV